MARLTREGGWDVGDSGVDGGWLWISNCYGSRSEGQNWGRFVDRTAVGRSLAYGGQEG
jgi:hypothetical protein